MGNRGSAAQSGQTHCISALSKSERGKSLDLFRVPSSMRLVLMPEQWSLFSEKKKKKKDEVVSSIHGAQEVC